MIKRQGYIVRSKKGLVGYLFNDEIGFAQRVRVRLVNSDFMFNGKTLRARISTLKMISKFETSNYEKKGSLV